MGGTWYETEDGKIEMQAPVFRVKDSIGRVLLEVSAEQMTADMESVRTPLGGLSVQQEMRTPTVLGMAHQDLRQVDTNAVTRTESIWGTAREAGSWAAPGSLAINANAGSAASVLFR